ncbi:hypothetical protein ABC733_25690 [Mangrovibacter sp. SLW1]
MTPTQQRMLVLLAVLLSSALCLGFLPISRFLAVLVVVAIWGSAAVCIGLLYRRENAIASTSLAHLPGRPTVSRLFWFVVIYLTHGRTHHQYSL